MNVESVMFVFYENQAHRTLLHILYVTHQLHQLTNLLLYQMVMCNMIVLNVNDGVMNIIFLI